MTHDPYARMAPIYDLVTVPFLDPVRRAVCRVAAETGARRAVDMCSGTGRQVFMLAAMGVETLGVDLSPSMLAKAAVPPRGLVPRGGGTARFVRTDAAHLEVPEASFDLALTTLSLHEMPDAAARAIFAEMWRVVRPGGVVAVADYVPPATAVAGAARFGVMAAEFSAGLDHFRNYRRFMAAGGMPGFLESLSGLTRAAPRLSDPFLVGNAALAIMVRGEASRG